MTNDYNRSNNHISSAIVVTFLRVIINGVVGSANSAVYGRFFCINKTNVRSAEGLRNLVNKRKYGSVASVQAVVSGPMRVTRDMQVISGGQRQHHGTKESTTAYASDRLRTLPEPPLSNCSCILFQRKKTELTITKQRRPRELWFKTHSCSHTVERNCVGV